MINDADLFGSQEKDQLCWFKILIIMSASHLNNLQSFYNLRDMQVVPLGRIIEPRNPVCQPDCVCPVFTFS